MKTFKIKVVDGVLNSDIDGKLEEFSKKELTNIIMGMIHPNTKGYYKLLEIK